MSMSCVLTEIPVAQKVAFRKREHNRDGDQNVIYSRDRRGMPKTQRKRKKKGGGGNKPFTQCAVTALSYTQLYD